MSTVRFDLLFVRIAVSPPRRSSHGFERKLRTRFTRRQGQPTVDTHTGTQSHTLLLLYLIVGGGVSLLFVVVVVVIVVPAPVPVLYLLVSVHFLFLFLFFFSSFGLIEVNSWLTDKLRRSIGKVSASMTATTTTTGWDGMGWDGTEREQHRTKEKKRVTARMVLYEANW